MTDNLQMNMQLANDKQVLAVPEINNLSHHVELLKNEFSCGFTSPGFYQLVTHQLSPKS